MANCWQCGAYRGENVPGQLCERCLFAKLRQGFGGETPKEAADAAAEQKSAESIAAIKSLGEDVAKLRTEAQDRVEEREREIAKLPKCPECQSTLEGNRPKRCPACRSRIFWMLLTPIDARRARQACAAPFDDPVVIDTHDLLKKQLAQYCDMQADVSHRSWIQSAVVDGASGDRNRHARNAIVLRASAESQVIRYLDKMEQWERPLLQTCAQYKERLATLIPQLKQEQRAMTGLFVWWGGLCLLLLPGLVLSPVFILGWWIIKQKQERLSSQITPLEAQLTEMQDLLRATGDRVRYLRIAYSVSQGHLSAVHPEFLVAGSNLDADQRSVLAAISYIEAVRGLQQADEAARQLRQDLGEISRECEQEIPLAIHRLDELLAVVQKAVDGDLPEKIYDGVPVGGDKANSAGEEHRQDDVHLIIDALAIIAVSDKKITGEEIDFIMKCLGSAFGEDIASKATSREDVVRRAQAVVKIIKESSLTAFANELSGRLRLCEREKRALILKLQSEVVGVNGKQDAAEERVVAWFKQQFVD